MLPQHAFASGALDESGTAIWTRFVEFYATKLRCERVLRSTLTKSKSIARRDIMEGNGPGKCAVLQNQVGRSFGSSLGALRVDLADLRKECPFCASIGHGEEVCSKRSDWGYVSQTTASLARLVMPAGVLVLADRFSPHLCHAYGLHMAERF